MNSVTERARRVLDAPTSAAITLGPMGGGIAAVSRMTWRLFQETWPDARLISLESETPGASPRPTWTTQLRFGAALLGRQLMADSGWVFFNHLALARAQSYVPRAIRRPSVIFLHGIEAWRPLAPAVRAAVADASLLIANSRHTATRAEAANPGLGPVALCPLAIDVDVIKPHPAGAATATASEPPRVLIVGRIVAAERYKGHDQLLEAWPGVLSHVPHARLVFAGTGDDIPRLEAKAQALGVRHALDITGFVTNEARESLYREATVFAMPSAGEGFGLVYLEAMAHGMPCIGSTNDAAEEVIVDGATGYLVQQDNTTALSDRLVTLLTDPGRRRDMGEAGRRRVASQFSYGQFSERLLSLLVGSADRLQRRRPAA